MLYCVHLLIPLLLILLVNFILCSVPSLILRLLGMTELSEKWVRLNTVVVCRIILAMLGADIVVSGQYEKAKKITESGKGAVFVSNHCSMLDIPVVLKVFSAKTGFVAKMQLAFVPFVNVLCLLLNCVFINRKDMRKGLRAIRKGVEKIRRGTSLLVFPEGTRSKTGLISSFKRGSFRLASESNAVIVPLVIKGDRELVENRNGFFKKNVIKLHVLEPVETENKNRTELYEIEIGIEKEVKEVYEQL